MINKTESTQMMSDQEIAKRSDEIFTVDILREIAEKIGRANPGKNIVVAYQNPREQVMILAKEGQPIILGGEKVSGKQAQQNPYMPVAVDMEEVLLQAFGRSDALVVSRDNTESIKLEDLLLEEDNPRSQRKRWVANLQHQEDLPLRWRQGLAVKEGRADAEAIFTYTSDVSGLKRVIMNVKESRPDKILEKMAEKRAA